MDQTELIEFIILLVAMTLVLQSNFNSIFMTIIPWIALLGAFYFVFGMFSRMVGLVIGKHFARRDDWWNGLAILSVVVLISGQQQLAINSVGFFLNAIWAGIRAFLGML